MNISADIFATIDDKLLLDILDKNPALKNFVEQEADRMKDDIPGKKCGCCGGGGCQGCGHSGREADAGYLTAALISIFNYYIPDDIKNAINMGSSTIVE